jgi:hypothetical protein
MQTTFLGHQGWLFATDETRILVDPLLVEEIGHAGALGCIYPPRSLDVRSFPPINAVFLTHEHEDHFNIPSLNRLDRKIPIYLPERSSIAARRILEEMGFRVSLVSPGDVLAIGDLDIYTFSPDHRGGQHADEWDVLPFLVKDRHGDGSFFSTVDVELTAEMRDAARAIAPRPGLYCFTNNTTYWDVLLAGKLKQRRIPDTAVLTRGLISAYRRLCYLWSPPAAALICGGGFAFPGDRAWLNQHVFTADSAAAFTAMRSMFPDRLFIDQLPGQTITMKRGNVSAVEDRTPFLSALPPSEWPSREYRPVVSLMEEYRPATGRTTLPSEDREALARKISSFGERLYGGRIHSALYSLTKEDLRGRKPTFVIVLYVNDDGDTVCFEYRPQASDFVPVSSADPFGEYVAGMECWATDLLSMLSGDLGPFAITFGRMRSWTTTPKRSVFDFGLALGVYYHPLRTIDNYLRLYRGLLAKEPAEVPQIPAAL